MTKLSLLKKIYHILPIKFRYRFSTKVWSFFYNIKKFFNPLYPQVFVFKGLEKNSQLPLIFAYIGQPSQTQEYWAQTVLAPGFQKLSLGRHFYSFIISFLKKNFLDCNFLVIEYNFLTHYSFSKKTGFNIPRWVNMEIDILKPIEKLLGNARGEIQRRIRKYQLSYEITHDPKCFDDFYNNMYLPYTKTRYKDAAMIYTHEKLFEIFSKGELILIKKEGFVIAAGLIELGDKNVLLSKLGIRDGNSKYVYWGAIGAIYYFMLIEMKKKGYKKLSIGGSRPFLSDGVTKYKRSLNANLLSNDSKECVWLKLLNNSPGVQSFLINNPFIFYTKDRKSHLAMFMDEKESCSQYDLKEALHVYDCNGIDETNLFFFSNNLKPEDYKESLPDSTYLVQSAKDLFLD